MGTAIKYNLILIFILNRLIACQCPVIEWTKETANKNDVIFRGVIKNIVLHQNNYTIADIEVLHLFKGNPFKLQRVLFPENDPCAIPINIGEEWLIYGKNKQLNSCEIEWCGWSRKKFVNDGDDFFIATHIITYEEEITKLKNTFPEIVINASPSDYFNHKNIIPDKYEFYIYIALSLIGFLLFLYISKKYIK